MAIYNIFDYSEKCSGEKEDFNVAFPTQENDPAGQEEAVSRKDRFFSSLAARLFFLLLLFADMLWGVYSVIQFLLFLTLNIFTGFNISRLQCRLKKSLISIRRFVVCALALFIAIFSPSLGILFSCMYFMMYDKEGIEEVVPESLRSQFQEIFPGKP
ncbi:MAG: hypothetical protein Tsb0015_04670 [Simkaniaceae bacterium]